MIKNDYNDNEYFLLENRQKTGCDLHLRGHGLLITHIDYDKHLFDLNVVNRTGIEGNDHERVAVVLADNDTTISRYTDEFIIDYQGDLYPRYISETTHLPIPHSLQPRSTIQTSTENIC